VAKAKYKKGRSYKMKKRNFCIALGLLAAFALWTIAIRFIDVQPIGPQGSTVGFATLNSIIHTRTGVHMQLYTITDWLGLVPVAFGLGFAMLGLAQWIKRKSLLKVDRSILVLGGFYIATMVAYLVFESFVINYRPVLIAGNLEASYPSSTTLLVLCVMPTAMMQLRGRINNRVLRGGVSIAIASFIVFMVAGRLVSGVHWLTDIIGGILLSAGLVTMYDSLIGEKN
jgi:undecaprenyl-diphosphatase